MKEWERALLEHDTPDAETITQSELESIIEECDTVPTTARVVPTAMYEPLVGRSNSLPEV